MKTVSILSHFIFFINAEAQITNSQHEDDQSNSQGSATNFQPSLAVVIGMLSIVFALTFVLLLYAKFCYRRSPNSVTAEQPRAWLIPSSRPRSTGIEKKVIESLPFFRFSLLKGSREGLECAVCLSKFDDLEILRLLPKCKHAFHMECIDHWLEKHSSCPLCRQKVGMNDLSQMAYSNSFRFLWNQTELRQESNLEMYVQREEDHRFGSSRSRFDKGKNVEDIILPIQEPMDLEDQNKKTLHRFNHKIVVYGADVVIKNRWSNVSPSDIMSLNSEMISDVSSSRFSCSETTNMEQGMGKRIDWKTNQNHDALWGFESKVLLNQSNINKRSMSEIIVHPRFMELKNVGDHSSAAEDNVKEERMRRLWLPIARKTLHWLANRETKPPHNIEKL